MEGAVVYSNASKVRCCNVSAEVIDTHGAVSEPVARALAKGIRSRAQTTWELNTGIAGPGVPDQENQWVPFIFQFVVHKRTITVAIDLAAIESRSSKEYSGSDVSTVSGTNGSRFLPILHLFDQEWIRLLMLCWSFRYCVPLDSNKSLKSRRTSPFRACH